MAGDTLSTIAARVSDRGGRDIWQTADTHLRRKSGAFIGGNQDLIKLGSEIEIPPANIASATPPPATDESPAAPELPSTAVAQSGAPTELVERGAPATVDQAEQVPDVAKPAELTESVIPAATPSASAADTVASPSPAPVFQDEQARPAAVEAPAATGNAEVPSSRIWGSNAPPWLAALVGLLFGAGASIVLLRDRLVVALRTLFARRASGVMRIPADSAVAARSPAVPVQIKTPMVAPESSMVVVEERREDADAMHTARADQTDRHRAVASTAPESARDTGLDNELSSLFGNESDLQSFGGQDSGMLPSDEELDLDLSAATPDVIVDEDIGWLGDETALTPTQKSGALAGSSGDTVEHVDLQTLSHKAIDDAQLSQTLKDALNLLESDYEDELTSSQVVGRTKPEDYVDDAGQDDTLIRTGTDHRPRR